MFSCTTIVLQVKQQIKILTYQDIYLITLSFFLTLRVWCDILTWEDPNSCFVLEVICNEVVPIVTMYTDHSLFINCGGAEREIDGNTYEADVGREGISNFVPNDKWAYSSTGVYLGKAKADYIATNTFSLNIAGPEFYQTARLSPLSLKYHGLCMLNGNYKVTLHFAEIMYSDDHTFSSLGRRIFDVSIQVSNQPKYFLAITTIFIPKLWPYFRVFPIGFNFV